MIKLNTRIGYQWNVVCLYYIIRNVSPINEFDYSKTQEVGHETYSMPYMYVYASARITAYGVPIYCIAI